MTCIVMDDGMIRTAKNDTLFTEAVDQEIVFHFPSCSAWIHQASGLLCVKVDVSFIRSHELVNEREVLGATRQSSRSQSIPLWKI